MSPHQRKIFRNRKATAPLLSFEVFDRLPAEIRIKIWKHALPDTRLVPIQYHQATQTYVSRIQAPALLHTCQESRTEAQKIYQELKLGEIVSRVEPGCYVDFSRDQVYLSSDFKPDFDVKDVARNERAYQLARAINLREVNFDLRNIRGDFFAAWDSMTENEAELLATFNISWDLRHSDHGRHLLQTLTIDYETWKLVSFSLLSDACDFPMKHLTVAVERGDGPLVHAPRLIDCEPEKCCNDSPVTTLLHCQNKLHLCLGLQKLLANGDLSAAGHSQRFSYKTSVKFLDTIEWVEKEGQLS